MLLVLDYLKNHTLDQLKNEHGVFAHLSQCGSKICLSCDGFFSKEEDAIADQCLGVVVRHHNKKILKAFSRGDVYDNIIVGEVELLAWPLNKIYDARDIMHVNDVNWFDLDLRIYDKLDGVMIVVFWDPFEERWKTSTRRMPDANTVIRDCDIEVGNMTYHDLFILALKRSWEENVGAVSSSFNKIEQLVDGLEKDVTYVFELTSPIVRNVVSYQETFATLIAARNIVTGKELDILKINLTKGGHRRPKTHDLGKLMYKTLRGTSLATATNALHVEAAIRFIDTKPAFEAEGVVLCDSKFNRAKLKSADWLTFSKRRTIGNSDLRTKRSTLAAIITGNLNDVLPYLNDSALVNVWELHDRYVALCKEWDAKFVEYKRKYKGKATFEKAVTDIETVYQPFVKLYEEQNDNISEAMCELFLLHQMHDHIVDRLMKCLDEMIVVTAADGTKTFESVTRGPSKRIGMDVMFSPRSLHGRWN